MSAEEKKYQQAILLLKYVKSRKHGQTAEEFLKETGLSPDSDMWEESVSALQYAEKIPPEHLMRQARTMLESLGNYADSAQKASQAREILSEMERNAFISDDGEIKIASAKKEAGILIPLLLLCAAGAAGGWALASHRNPESNPTNSSPAANSLQTAEEPETETQKQTETVPETQKQTEAVTETQKQTKGDDTLTIVCWTDADLANMFDLYTPVRGAKPTYVNVGSYTGGEASTQYATFLNSGDDIDLFVAEAGWILNFINDSTYSAPLSDIGITASEYADAYPYTIEIGTNDNNELCAVSWQCCPGCYAYNADLAAQYLGITSPEEMQNKISDWDNFAATAEELKTASDGTVTITATIDGMWQAYSTGQNIPWVKNQVIQTETARNFTDIIKNMYQMVI